MSDDKEIRYKLEDAPKMMVAKLLNNIMEAVFILALVFFAYNCDWCGGPRMW
jgi:hypothetical protein